MKYTIVLVLALVAAVASDAVPEKKVEKRGIIGGYGLGGLGLGYGAGLPLGYGLGAPLAASLPIAAPLPIAAHLPIASAYAAPLASPYGLGLHAPILGAGLPYSYGLGGIW